MDEKSSHASYPLALAKFALFLVCACLVVHVSAEMWSALRVSTKGSEKLIVIAILSTFAWYAFIADLNETYERIQNFFFRTDILSLVIPSALLLSGIGFLVIPRFFETGFNRHLFMFIGGCAVTIHALFIARQIKGTTFLSFINYLFTFSLLVLVLLALFALYVRIGYNVHPVRIFSEGFKGAGSLVADSVRKVWK